MMKRLSSAEYEEILAIMRKWPKPYITYAGKLVGQIRHMFEENKRLEQRVKELEQLSCLPEAEKVLKAFPGSKIIPHGQPLPKTDTKKKYPLHERLKLMERGSPEWNRALKYNCLTEEHALKLIGESK